MTARLATAQRAALVAEGIRELRAGRAALAALGVDAPEAPERRRAARVPSRPHASRASPATLQLADRVLVALTELGEARAVDLAVRLLGDASKADRVGIAARTLARRGLVTHPREGSWASTTAGRASRATP